MSRLGKKPLPIPDKVKAEFKNNALEITGPLGKFVQPVDHRINVKVEPGQILVEPKGTGREFSMLHGLTRGLIKNGFEGVSLGFKKNLEVQGLGYKVAVEGKTIVLQLGFSHPVQFPIPDGIKITVDKATLISITGVSKSQIGEMAARIRALRPPEPYKGTGVRYAGEHIIRKAGKTAAGAAGGGAGKK